MFKNEFVSNSDGRALLPLFCPFRDAGEPFGTVSIPFNPSADGIDRVIGYQPLVHAVKAELNFPWENKPTSVGSLRMRLDRLAAIARKLANFEHPNVIAGYRIEARVKATTFEEARARLEQLIDGRGLCVTMSFVPLETIVAVRTLFCVVAG